MSNSYTHSNIKVKCNMDEPIELLIDKLSTKSNELYIFWQNYNQMYRQYNEKLNENAKLKEEIEHLRRNYNNKMHQDTNKNSKQEEYLNQKLGCTEKANESFKAEIEQMRKVIEGMKLENHRHIEENSQMQILINQLRQENSIQKSSISSILLKLKNAQNESMINSKVQEELEQKQNMISKLLEKERELELIISEREEEIQEYGQIIKENKIKYEKILKQTLQIAKQNTLNSLSPKIYRQKVKISNDI